MTGIDLRTAFGVLWRWLWLIALATALAAGASYYATRSMPTMYRTSTTLAVGDQTDNPRLSAEELATSQRLVSNYAAMARRQPVLEAAIHALGLQMDWRALQSSVLVYRAEGTVVFEVQVVDSDPDRAKALADEIARQLILQSPTSEGVSDVNARREFVRRQISSLQQAIEQSELELARKQAELARAVSARAVLELQDEVRALDLKLNSWRASYASLLTAYEGKGPNTLEVIEPAYVPSEPLGPSARVYVLLAALLGFLMGTGAALLIEHISDAVSTPGDVARTLGVPTLGSIQKIRGSGKPTDDLVTFKDPNSPVSEAFRLLRTNLLYSHPESDPIVVLVTSPGPGEGKSVVAANLAASFAQTGRRTVLVDVDLRNPSAEAFFGAGNRVGLTSLFLDDAIQSGAKQPIDREALERQLKRRIEPYLVPTAMPNLRVLASGPRLVVNPGELLASGKMEVVMHALKEMADVVILDSPPVLPVADATILSRKAGAAVLVLEAGRTRTQRARAAAQALERSGAKLLGVVLNKAREDATSSYKHRYTSRPPSRQIEWSRATRRVARAAKVIELRLVTLYRGMASARGLGSRGRALQTDDYEAMPRS